MAVGSTANSRVRMADDFTTNGARYYVGNVFEALDTPGQWYLHLFLPEQPDLNWRNPNLKAAMFDVARFWLERGVDGFRLDAIGTVYENPDLPDHAGRSLLELQQEGINAKTPEEYKKLETAWQTLFQYQQYLNSFKFEFIKREVNG